MEEFQKSLQTRKQERVRFKINYHPDDLARMLSFCYKQDVDKFRCGAVYENNPHINDYIKRIARWLAVGTRPGLMMNGSYGNGKSSMGRSICELIRITHQNYLGQVEWYNNPMQVSALNMAKYAKEDSKKFNEMKTSRILFIDDVGVEPADVKSFGNVISPFTEIMYERYDKQLLTIISSNLYDSDILTFYGPRIDDRFNEMFDRIVFENESFRK